MGHIGRIDDREVRMTAPGIRGYHQVYTSVMQSVAERWKKYAGVPVASDIGLAREQDRAWGDYRRNLSRRGWTPESVMAAWEQGMREDIKLDVQIPIHTTYITAWANRQGTVSFRDDIYEYDAAGKVDFEQG